MKRSSFLKYLGFASVSPSLNAPLPQENNGKKIKPTDYGSLWDYLDVVIDNRILRDQMGADGELGGNPRNRLNPAELDFLYLRRELHIALPTVELEHLSRLLDSKGVENIIVPGEFCYGGFNIFFYEKK